MSDTLIVGFRIPYDGLPETTYFALANVNFVEIKDDSSVQPDDWLICDSDYEVKQVYEEFPCIK